MIVRKILIERDGDYGQSKIDETKPLRASITVQGDAGKVELRLDSDLSRRVLELISSEIAAAGKATAEALVAEVSSLAPQAA